MNKKIKKFLSSFIPSRGLRFAVRNGMARRYLAFKEELRRAREPATFQNYLSAAAIIKNEAPYIAEWIEYHIIMGFTKFYIYDNDSTDNIDEILAPYIRGGIVEAVKWPGTGQQSAAYDNAISLHKNSTRWMAFLDLDEFVVPLSTATVAEFMRTMEKYSGACINWLVYGDNGHRKKTNGLVIERFRARSMPEFERNRLVKSIVNPRRVFHMGAHWARFAGNERAVDPNGRKISKVRAPVIDKIRINHYYGKSREEFMIKKYKGNVGFHHQNPIEDALFDHNNRNDVLDDTMDKYVPLIKAAIKKRFQ